jgi:lipopolysaccharide export system permease protein
MTTYGHSGALQAAPAAPRRRVLIAPFGEFTRYRLISHIQHVMIVVCALDIIALTLDLSRKFASVMAQNPDASGIGAVLWFLWYVLLRSVEVTTQLLPFACFLGVLWSEVNHTWTRERLMIWNCGRSPAQCMMPAILCGLIFGMVQFTLEIYLRPLVTAYQVEARIWDMADRYTRMKGQPTWIAAGLDLVYSRMDFGPPPELVGPTIFRLDAGGQVRSVINGQSAVPGERQGEWIVRNGTRWDAELGTDPNAPDYQRRRQPPSPDGLQVQFVEQTIDLKIDPLWFNTRGIPAWRLPQPIIMALADAPAGYHATSEFRTWVHARYGRPMFVMAMALLSAALAMLMLPYRAGVQSFLVITLIGYGMHGFLKVMEVIGEHNYISPPAAAWLPSILVLLSTACLLLFQERERFPLLQTVFRRR